ncbi:MAG: preprotein translocase subunit YajC [Rickettsiales bacterium]|nr:preprotein translocase subunit YajC [Rickettsiales bacterium]
MSLINQAIASEIAPINTLDAAPQQPTASGFVPILLIFVIFYFLLIRPQQKKLKEHKVMVNGLAKGQSVITAGGIVGKVVKVKDSNYIEVQIAKDVIIKVLRSTISNTIEEKVTFVAASEETKAKPKKEKKAKKEPKQDKAA